MKKLSHITVLLILFSCSNENPEALWNKAINMRTENNLKESITLYNKIISDYPNHDLSVKSQFQIAEIYLNDIKEYDIAIHEFNTVITNYPDRTEAMNSLFMIAYIYNNYLNAYSDAIEYYNLFLNSYPNAELIPSVKYELKGLEKYQNEIDSLNNIINKKNL